MTKDEILKRCEQWFAAYMHDRENYDEATVLLAALRNADEPTPEREGMKFGCSGCGAVVTLTFTDSTKQHVDIRSIEGWTAGVGGTWCPQCASSLNRRGEPNG